MKTKQLEENNIFAQEIAIVDRKPTNTKKLEET